MNDTAMAAASLTAVRHRYGDAVALNGVSMLVPAGCMAGLIGPDGAGKSTVLALISGVRKIQQGKVVALDGDMGDPALREARRSRVAYMPQGLGRNLYPSLSVAENLDFFGRLFGQEAEERRDRIADLLRSTGLDPFIDRPAGALSGGMKQKLGLCCALIHDPDLLILDEPTTGVDPLSRRQFWALIDRIRKRRPGMSVLVATAYMDEAQRFDWLGVMDGGLVTAVGSPADILAKTGAVDLEAAFIALLPEAKRAEHKPVSLRPRKTIEGPPAIEAESLTKRFGSFVAVNDVSFRIEQGEIFGFLGSNGCGKSTTMKMLTGLLPATSGHAKLLGEAVDGESIEARKRVGYMSQAFSLYGELTVRQNLDLHASLFDLPKAEAGPRVAELLDQYGLAELADARPESLPLGVRQRLQLAVAVLHRPDILILDEPTSGVDPVARDQFWQRLINLSRDDGVTLFISTHFMNEAERCDRISLMQAGNLLAMDAPAALIKARGAKSLEEAFIAYLVEAEGGAKPPPEDKPGPIKAAGPARRFFDARRCWAYARRECVEILRDRARLAFAFFGPVILMLTFGYGISFDVEHLPYAVYDQDQSLESRQLLEGFQNSRYFDELPDIADAAAMERRLRQGELAIAIEVPAGFGRDLLNARRPEIAVWLDGSMPFRAETVKGYVAGLAQAYQADQALRRTGAEDAAAAIGMRFRYNQDFRSVFAIVPGVVMLMLVLIPAMMTAVGVVQEKESGSISNFRSTPVTRLEFLLGKQAPYALIALISFLTLAGLAWFPFGVGVKGSQFALLSGVALYVLATTGFGLLISAFAKTQVAAIFATSIIAIVPAVNFSGLLTPVSSLSGGARWLGLAFPAAWFQQISVGAFTKGLGFAELWRNHAALASFAVLFMAAAVLALKKQEA